MIGWPALSIWRAPTDNDDPPGEWRATTPAARWRADGLDRLVDAAVRDQTPRASHDAGRRLRDRHRPADRASAAGRGRRRVGTDQRSDHGRPFDHRPAARRRAGSRCPPHFDRLTWLGLGPGDSYPDRRAAVRFGQWEAKVGELTVPFVRPQEYGLHLDTEWFELASPAVTLRVDGDRPLAFSALPHSVEELETATHAHLLPPSSGHPRAPRRRPPRSRHGRVRSRHPSPSPRPSAARTASRGRSPPPTSSPIRRVSCTVSVLGSGDCQPWRRSRPGQPVPSFWGRSVSFTLLGKICGRP